MPTYRTGSDGKKIKLPDGWTARQGFDGRIVPIRLGATARQGSDRRLVEVRNVAIPLGRIARVQSNGRLKLVPNS